MKILIASTPATGHLNPLLSVASILVKSGHEVAVQVNEDLRATVEASGHHFIPEIPNAQTSGRYFLENYPESMRKSPGMEMTGPFLCPQHRRPARQPQDGALRLRDRSHPR